MGDWKVYAGAVLSFSTLAGATEIASTRRWNLTKLGITFQGLLKRRGYEAPGSLRRGMVGLAEENCTGRSTGFGFLVNTPRRSRPIAQRHDKA